MVASQGVGRATSPFSVLLFLRFLFLSEASDAASMRCQQPRLCYVPDFASLGAASGSVALGSAAALFSKDVYACSVFLAQAKVWMPGCSSWVALTPGLQAGAKVCVTT